MGALFQSKLKSQLDLSFANVNLAQAKLLLLDAQNNQNAALAALSAVLGFSNLQSFQLVEDSSPVLRLRETWTTSSLLPSPCGRKSWRWNSSLNPPGSFKPPSATSCSPTFVPWESSVTLRCEIPSFPAGMAR